MSNIIQINNGLWGHRHKRYLQEHKRAVYITLLTSGKLNEYLADVDKQAEERFERLVEQMKQSQDTTEQLKSENALSPVTQIKRTASFAFLHVPCPICKIRSLRFNIFRCPAAD